MSDDTFIARLEQRAHTGDNDAIRDLATWRRIIARGGITPDEQQTTITLPLEEF